MKILILIFSIFLHLNAFSAEICKPNQDSASPKPAADLVGLEMALIANMASQENEVSVDAGKTYLMSIQTSLTFKETDAQKFINTLTPICENSGLKSKFRANACVVVSGLHGKLAQKLQMSGVANGKSAYKYLQLSLSLDPNNTDAILGHAVVIVGLSDQGWMVRKLAEKSLDTSIKAEASKAKQNLERINQTTNPVYKQILGII